MRSFIDVSFDESFNEHILSTQLTWLPWVGDNYRNLRKRFMIVGESHYYNEIDANNPPSESNRWNSYPEYTRNIILESPIRRDWKNKTFQNIERVLLGKSTESAKEMWRSLAFYNFVQRPMDFSVTERPTWSDFYKGWQSFLTVLKVLRPQTCLFIGVESSNYFNQAMKELGVEHEKVRWDKKISRTYSRLATVTIDGTKTRLIFIQHAGKWFSWSRWRVYLRAKIIEEMSLFDQIDSVGLCGEVQEQLPDVEDESPNLEGLPLHLGHKPIIACDYSELEGSGSDAKFMSVGHAQYDRNSASIKVWRHTGNRWSRQSEEVPIGRVFDIALILGSAIKTVQCNGKLERSLLGERLIAEEDLGFIAQEIQTNKTRIADSARALRELLNEINLDEL